jgi:hypothetical protein
VAPDGVTELHAIVNDGTLNYFLITPIVGGSIGSGKAHMSLVLNHKDRVNMVRHEIDFRGQAYAMFEPSDEVSFDKIGEALATESSVCFGVTCFDPSGFYSKMKTYQRGY